VAKSTMNRARSRVVVQYVVLLLATYLAVDTATPLLPGAFRFDLRESVEAGGRPSLPLIVFAGVARSSDPAPAASTPTPRTLRSAPPPRPAPHFVSILHPSDSDTSSHPPEDD
jgi:hypothetical protein